MGVPLNLRDIQSGFLTASAHTANNTLIETAMGKALDRTGSNNNAMEVDLDMGLNKIFNVCTDPNDPSSLATIGDLDDTYVIVSGDTMEGPLNVLPAVQPEEAVQKQQLDDVVDGYQAGDANLQAQLTGNVPLAASAFSPISWHIQSVDNSVVIPDNMNAWSFGPTMSISAGQSVTVGNGSFWTIAEGENTGGSGSQLDLDEGLL